MEQDFNFYTFSENSIGRLIGYRRIDILPEDFQKILDLNTRAKMEFFNPGKGLSSDEYSKMFIDSFMKSRRDVKEDLNNMKDLFYVTVQVGNIECLDYIRIIEKSDWFHIWQNENLVNLFKENSRLYL